MRLRTGRDYAQGRKTLDAGSDPACVLVDRRAGFKTRGVLRGAAGRHGLLTHSGACTPGPARPRRAI